MKTRVTLLVIVVFVMCLPSIVPADAAERLTRQIDAVYRDIRIIIDGEEITPTYINGKIVEPFIVDGTTYVPLRAIGEAFGKDVEWVGENSTILIKSPREMWDKPDFQNVPPAPSKKVTVSTPQELADAIAPDVCITLTEGVYNMSTVTKTENKYIQVGNETAALIVSDVEGLTLQAASGAKVEIVTPNQFSEVLMFTLCNGIKISGIRAGHTVTSEYKCDAGVVLLDQSANIDIVDCVFYGSGAVGLSLRNSVSARIANVTVTDCSLRAIDIWSSNSITFTDCKFINNRAYGSVIWGYYSSIEFIDCVISGNKNLQWSAVEIDDDVLFERCLFRDNALIEGSAPLFMGQGIRMRDCEIEKAGFSGYWDSGVVDLGGNKLR